MPPFWKGNQLVQTARRKKINMAIVGFSKTQTTTSDGKHKF
jgi:hypothetical protein